MVQRLRVWAALCALVVVIVAAVSALERAEAAGWAVAVFAGATFALIAALIVRPYSAFFTSLGAFLLLGFPVKFFVVTLTGGSYIEPIGDFDRSMEQWNEALLVASTALGAFAVAALADMPVGPQKVRAATIGSHPAYIRIEKPLALISIVVAVAVFTGNWYLGFVKIGIDHAVVLPRPLFVVVSFLVLWGAALWLACMAYWAWSGGRLPMWAVLALGIVEGFLAGVSNASRARYVFHVMGFVLGWLGTAGLRRDWWPGFVRLAGLAVFAGVCLAGSLLLVSLDRVDMYTAGSAYGSRESSAPAQEAPVVEVNETHILSQIPRLFIARWIGMEGVMTVVGAQSRGMDLFWAGVTESPDAGVDGIYERMSKSEYVDIPGINFLTTAGGVAILYYSGSLLVVFVGVFALSVFGVWVERLALFLTESPLASAVVAVCLANFVCQVNQPYVPMVFMLLMITACGCILAFRKVVLSMGAARGR